MQVPVSTVTDSERLLFRKLHYPGIYRCVARYGYHDQVHMGSKFVIKLLDKVMLYSACCSKCRVAASYVCPTPVDTVTLHTVRLGMAMIRAA